MALKNAWGELAAIEKETRRYKEIREHTEHELELCRQKGVKLEDVSIQPSDMNNIFNYK